MIVRLPRPLLPCALALCAAAALCADEWPMYLRDLAHSSFNPGESKIQTGNIPTLAPAWVTSVGSTVSAGVTVSDGILFVGAWDGTFYAIDSKDGSILWHTYVGKAPAPENPQCFAGIGVSAQAALDDKAVYVGGGDSAVYALDRSTGAVQWRVPLAEPKDGAYIWSSLTLHNHALYVGVASLGDCPLVRGLLARIDLAQPDQPLIRYMAPEDQVGGGIWSTPAIDAATNTVFVTTGTGDQDPDTGLWGGTMLSLDATTLDVLSYFLLPTNDSDGDIEWGSSPTLFQTANGDQLIAATGKDGILYAQHRDLSPAWTVRLALSCLCPECGCGSLSTPAFDGKHLYVGAGAAPDADLENGSVYAIDPATGTVVWKRLLAGVVIAPVTLANGMVFVSTTLGIHVFDCESGQDVWSDASYGPLYSQPVVVDGTLYTTHVTGRVVAWRFRDAQSEQNPAIKPIYLFRNATGVTGASAGLMHRRLILQPPDRRPQPTR